MTRVHGTNLPEHNLDLLRSIAVLAVLVDHTVGFDGRGLPFSQWLGHAGVLAFFVHTSLVLMSSMERDGAPTTVAWVRRFYVRRAWRVYPLALAVVALVLIFRIPPGSVASRYAAVSLSTGMANLALVQNLAGVPSVLAPLWTLPLELQMYAALPLCYMIVRRPSPNGMLSLLALGAALAWLFNYGVDPAHRIAGMWRFSVLDYTPCFLMGVLAYWLLRRGPPKLLPAWTFPFTIAAAVVLGYFVLDAVHLTWVIRIALCGAFGLSVALTRDAAPSPLARAAHTVATYSYGIYLFHMLALRIGFGVLRAVPTVVQGIVAIAVLAAMCYCGYHLIEKPGIRFGQRLLGARGRSREAEAAAP